MSRRPLVAVVAPGVASGGSVGAVALRHARLLTEEFDVVLVSDGSASGVEGVGQVSVGERPFAQLGRFGHVPREVGFACRARTMLRRIDAEVGLAATVCHGHVTAALAGNLLSRLDGVGCVLVTHGDIFDRPPGLYGAPLTALYMALTPRAYRDSDAVVALSPTMARWAERGGAEAGRVLVIPNGVDLEELGLHVSPVSTRVPWDRREPLRLLYVGRFSPEKGVPLLLEALRLLEARGVSATLDLAGDGKLEKSLRRDADGLGSRVRFLGKVTKQELGGVLGESHLVCVPSYSEAFPGVVLEALAAGTPVLATRAGGLPFVVRDGENGVLVPSGRPSAIADAVERIWRGELPLEALREAARPSVWPRFAWDRVGASLRRLVRAVIDGRSGFRDLSWEQV